MSATQSKIKYYENMGLVVGAKSQMSMIESLKSHRSRYKKTIKLPSKTPIQYEYFDKLFALI